MDIESDPVMTFAVVKYWTRATKGERQPGKRPDDIERAVEMMIAAMEMAWRAGIHRGCELNKQVVETIKRRREHGQ